MNEYVWGEKRRNKHVLVQGGNCSPSFYNLIRQPWYLSYRASFCFWKALNHLRLSTNKMILSTM